MSSLSAEAQISQAIRDLDISCDCLCAIAAIPGTRLSQALREIRPLDREQSVALLKLLTQLKDLVRRCEPIPVSLKNPRLIKNLLEKLDDGVLEITITQHDSQQAERNPQWPNTIAEFLAMPAELSDGLRKNSAFRKHLESL